MHRGIGDDLVRFIEIWSIYDPRATQYILSSKLQLLLVKLQPPLGIGASNTRRAEVLMLMKELKIPDHNGRLHFQEVLMALVSRVGKVDIPFHCALQNEISKSWANAFPQLATHGNAEFSATDIYAATFVQSTWRGFVERKKAQRQLAEQRHQEQTEQAQRIASHIIGLLSRAREDPLGYATSSSTHQTPKLPHER